MGYRLVEAVDLTSPPVDVDGQTLPPVCLMEDDEGSVWLQVIPPYPGYFTNIWAVWANRCQGIVSAHGQMWAHILREDFEALGVVSGLDDAIAMFPQYWVIHSERLSVREMIALRMLRDVDVRLEAKRSPFVHVHLHSEFSALDGLSTVGEIMREVKAHGQEAVALTDHGVNAGHPAFMKAAIANGVKPIVGQEAYFVPDRSDRTNQWSYFHLILLAYNQTGVNNLWSASTEANRSGFFGRPRMDFDILRAHSDGLMATTACLRGPLSELLLAGEMDAAQRMLYQLIDVFSDRLWVELHANQLPEQKRLNALLVSLAQRCSVPLVAAVDSHYPCRSDDRIHQLWIKAQTMGSSKDNKSDDSGLFSGRQPYHIMGRQEVADALSYLPSGAVMEALDQTAVIAERVQPYKTLRSSHPIYDIEKGRAYALDFLLTLCLANWDRKIRFRKISHSEQEYLERFEFEMDMLISKDFVDYFCIVSDYVRWAKRNGIIIGPGRGSGAASLVAYLADITEVDPLQYDLPFARFITPDRVDFPDFDVDFPASKRSDIQHYLAQRWGGDHVVRVGTHIRVNSKGAFRDLARVLTSEEQVDFLDLNVICSIIAVEEADTAGLGKPWEEILAANEVLFAPFIQRYPKLFAGVPRIVNRLKSYGKHPAGLVISTTETLTDRLPMRLGDEDQMVTELDFAALEAMGLLKFDILTLRTIDTLQACIDFIRERHGVSIDFYSWEKEFEDLEVWEAISNGDTLGVFQLETPGLTRMARRYQPRTVTGLADINSLVRPGPSRSGMTEIFFQRKNGQMPVQYAHPLLKPILSSTYGMVIYQEQVMRIVKDLASFDDSEANKVRSIMGKKKRDQVDAKGLEFVAGCLKNGIDETVSVPLWDQMAEFGRYAFSVCHAVPYSMMSFYCAWLRVKYPIEFFAAALSTVKKERVRDFISECQSLEIKVLPPDINLSGETFSPTDHGIVFGLLGVKDVGTAAIAPVIARRPYTSFEDFVEKMKGTKCNAGSIKVLISIGAFDSLYPNRRELEVMWARSTSGDDDRCVNLSSTVNEWGLGCSYDWASEPVRLTKTGREQKRQDPPKRCTKGCRQYQRCGPIVQDISPYSRQEIIEREQDIFGVALTFTVFDRIPSEMWGRIEGTDTVIHTGKQIESFEAGSYNTIACLQSVRVANDSTGKRMAFLKLYAKDRELSAVVFASLWKELSTKMRVNSLGFYTLTKNDRGYALKGFSPIDE